MDADLQVGKLNTDCKTTRSKTKPIHSESRNLCVGGDFY